MGFTVKPNLRINNNDIESLSTEILSDKKNTLINGQIGPLESFLSNMFSKIKKIKQINRYCW